MHPRTNRHPNKVVRTIVFEQWVKERDALLDIGDTSKDVCRTRKDREGGHSVDPQPDYESALYFGLPQ